MSKPRFCLNSGPRSLSIPAPDFDFYSAKILFRQDSGAKISSTKRQKSFANFGAFLAPDSGEGIKMG